MYVPFWQPEGLPLYQVVNVHSRLFGRQGSYRLSTLFKSLYKPPRQAARVEGVSYSATPKRLQPNGSDWGLTSFFVSC